MAQSGKCLPCKQQGLSLIPRTCVKMPGLVVGFCTWEMEADPWGSLPRQPRLTGVQIEGFVIE